MNARPPLLILHVGQHKTGSKALQSFLAENRDVLRRHGILYPAEVESGHGIRAYSISHFRLFALLRREAIAACLGEPAAESDWARHAPFCRPFETARDFFESFDAERRRSGLDRVVVSAKDLFDMHTAHELTFAPGLIEAAAGRLAALAAEFGYVARVVAYLRRQDHLLGAHYVQFIKGSPVHAHDFEAFRREFAPRLDAQAILARWADAFGPDRLVVRPYERSAQPAGIVPDFFEHALGLPVPSGCVDPPEDVETVNRTLDRDFVEFIRALNRRSAAGRTVFDRAAVLEAALRPDAPSGAPTGIAGWLSPAGRRDLLADHRDGNAAISRRFLGRVDDRLFAEPPPDDVGWAPYPGLSADRATAIALAVHKATLARLTPPPAPVPLAPRAPRRRLARRLREAVARLKRRAVGRPG